MFGVLKENVLNKLEETYTNKGEKEFKKDFYSFIKVIKENKNLKEFYEVYDLFKQVNFLDEQTAKEFIEESVKYLKGFNKNNFGLLEQILGAKEKKTLNPDSVEYKLDQLVFNENINLQDKVVIKVNLMKQIVNKNNEKIDYQQTINQLYSKINENVSKLNETQTKVLDLFIENDNKKINEYYQNLITETTELVDQKVIKSDNVDVAKRLLEVKIKLNNLKSETPSVSEIEKIVSLKESFS
jgi:hypothetical protein